MKKQSKLKGSNATRAVLSRKINQLVVQVNEQIDEIRDLKSKLRRFAHTARR